MHNAPDLQSPDAQVAHRIVDRFLDDGLLSRDLANRLLTQFTEGALRADDWRALAGQALAWEQENERGADDDLW